MKKSLSLVINHIGYIKTLDSGAVYFWWPDGRRQETGLGSAFRSCLWFSQKQGIIYPLLDIHPWLDNPLLEGSVGLIQQDSSHFLLKEGLDNFMGGLSITIGQDWGAEPPCSVAICFWIPNVGNKQGKIVVFARLLQSCWNKYTGPDESSLN